MDREGDALDARLVAFARFVQFDREHAGLCPTQVHAQEHLRPVLTLRATRSRVDAHDGVAGVELPGEEPLFFEVFEIASEISGKALDLFDQLLRHLVVDGLLLRQFENRLQVIHL